jgi:hypothetical protein
VRSTWAAWRTSRQAPLTCCYKSNAGTLLHQEHRGRGWRRQTSLQSLLPLRRLFIASHCRLDNRHARSGDGPQRGDKEPILELGAAGGSGVPSIFKSESFCLNACGIWSVGMEPHFRDEGFSRHRSKGHGNGGGHRLNQLGDSQRFNISAITP